MDEMRVFNISNETRGERPLLSLTVSLTSLLFLYLSSHSPFHSIISYVPLQPLPPLFGPIIFFSVLRSSCFSVSPSSVIQCGIISHLHSVSFHLPLSPSLVLLHSTFFTNSILLGAFPPSFSTTTTYCMTALGQS